MVPESSNLLARLRAYCFPAGEELARRVRGIQTKQRGEMRSSPTAPWIPFAAVETINARQSGFHWEARYQGGKMGLVTVTDAYEKGHGSLTIKLGGIIPVRKAQGPEFDKGELQRYLASVMICPPILLNHHSLDARAADARTLQLHDFSDPTGASVTIDVNEDGCPSGCRAMRPMAVGKQTLETPWSGACLEFHEWEGFLSASRIEASWELPEGKYAYYRSEIISCEVIS